MPNGTLNQNTQCHEIATSAPPSTGPITRPTAATIVFVPIARPSCSRGNASVTIAAALANRNAPPIALEDPPQDQLRAVAGEAGTERGEREHEEAADVRLLAPELIDSRPALRTSTVEAIMYTRITHTSSSRLVWRLRSRSGSAMISVPELIVASSIPRLVHDSAHHL